MRRIVLVCTVLLGCSAVATAATPQPGLDFDRTFAASDARQHGPVRQSYYAATYRVAGQDHRVAVWRDGERRIARRTDDALETHLTRGDGDGEWSMTVLDLKRRIRTDIDRTNLLRVGHYTDWFAQAHGLARPRGAYRLVALDGRPPGVDPIAACRWYALEQAERSSRLCWSREQGVPLVIVDARGDVVWRVTRVASGPFPASVFAIDDRGFARNDANRDIAAD